MREEAYALDCLDQAIAFNSVQLSHGNQAKAHLCSPLATDSHCIEGVMWPLKLSMLTLRVQMFGPSRGC